MAVIDKAVLRRVKMYDRIARWTITLGGALIIAGVIAILALIVGVTLPLFWPSRASLLVDSVALIEKDKTAAPTSAMGVDLVELAGEAGGDSLTAFTLDQTGLFRFLDLSTAESAKASATVAPPLLQEIRVDAPGDEKNQTIVSVERIGSLRFSLLWSGGGVTLVEAAIEPHFDKAGGRSVKCAARTLAKIDAEKKEKPLRALLRKNGDGATTCAKLLSSKQVVVIRQATTENALGESQTTSERTVIDDLPGDVSAMTMDASGKTLYLGTSDGCLVRREFDDEGKISYRETIPAFPDRRKITALAMLLGDVSLAVGDAQGEVTDWFEIREENSRKLRQIRTLASHASAVVELIPSSRDKTLVSRDELGVCRFSFATNARHLFDVSPTSDELNAVEAVAFSPRGNAFAVRDVKDRLCVWRIDNPHPQVSFNALFGKVHYEGYAEPSYKWQSSGDEPKYSLTPIIFGTIKSTIYALAFALPLGLFGAVYVSHFTTPALRRTIKPIVEIMAAVPSVVIGFLTLLWLGPVLSDQIMTVFAGFVTVPLAFVAFMLFWQWLRKYDWARRAENGYEFLILIPVVCLGAYLATYFQSPLERLLFHGDFKQWLFDATHKPYEALNSLAVAFGLGFAVIPIIFSLSEDSLSCIPHNLTAASLALGASRWQTLRRVILPSASPGIFAAAMVGFGRAVGETMIVFMATGNTAIMDWSPFNGFRTLSANVAVEMPEAAVGETLYRLLFLCAVILFVFTFVLNTTAELVRQHLRKRYGKY